MAMLPPPSLDTPGAATAHKARPDSSSSKGTANAGGRWRSSSDAAIRRASASQSPLSATPADGAQPAPQSQPVADAAAVSVDGERQRERSNSDASKSRPAHALSSPQSNAQNPTASNAGMPRSTSAPPNGTAAQTETKKKKVGLFSKRKDSAGSAKAFNDGPLKQDAQQAALVKEAIANKKRMKSPRGRRESNTPAKRTCAEWSERFPTLSQAQIEREMQATPVRNTGQSCVCQCVLINVAQDEVKLEARLREQHLRILETPPLSKSPQRTIPVAHCVVFLCC